MPYCFLTEESFMDNDDDDDTMLASSIRSTSSGGGVSERYCSDLLKGYLPSNFEIPNECYRFGSVRTGIIRRDSKKEDLNVAFEGMDPGSAIKAMTAREQGHPHTAQITRRLTSKSKESDSSWF
ncbi:MAG: hypothetical protein SGARI_002870 [Bacillariaceae sp.]